MNPDTPSTDTTYEYEFSTYSDGRIMFIHLWDRTDISACERILHRPVVETDITRSPTGNSFIVDDLGNKFTFNRTLAQRSFTRPDFGDLEPSEPEPKPAVNVMDILASL